MLKFLNTDTTKSAIVSLVTSRLDYCNGLLCGISDELLCRLQKVQNNAARVVSGSKKYDHITPVLKDLHCLPIRKRIEFKILLLTFKCMQGCAPLYLRELLVKQANTRTLRSNTKNLLQIPLTNLKRFGDRAFCAYAPRLWNELPDNIKAADSVQNFKKQLKTLLFRKEFNWLYGPWQLSNDSKALLNIIGGKGAISGGGVEGKDINVILHYNNIGLRQMTQAHKTTPITNTIRSVICLLLNKIHSPWELSDRGFTGILIFKIVYLIEQTHHHKYHTFHVEFGQENRQTDKCSRSLHKIWLNSSNFVRVKKRCHDWWTKCLRNPAMMVFFNPGSRCKSQNQEPFSRKSVLGHET